MEILPSDLDTSLGAAIETKSESLLKKIQSLNSVFDVADAVCSAEVVTFLDEKQKEYIPMTSPEYNIDTVNTSANDVLVNYKDVITLDLLITDFKFARETLHETVTNGRKIISTVTADILDSDSEDTLHRAELISSFSSLVSSVNSSVKLLSAYYKDIVKIIESIEAVRVSQSKGLSDKNGQNSQNGQNVNVENMFVVSSTTDIIKRIREQN